jgi:hypothetical protein
LHVSIEAREGSFVGQLRVADADGGESIREVTAPRCEELVDALAFLSAVTLTLGAEGTVPPVASPPSPPPASPAAPSLTPVPSTEVPHRWRFAVGGEALIAAVLVPSVRVAPEAFLEARRDGAGLLSPTIRLSGTRVTSGQVNAASGSGTASLTLTSASLEVCPVRWQPLASVRLLPCVGVRGGVLEGVGADVAVHYTENRAWLGADILGRTEWAPLSWLFFDLEGGGSAPILRYRFYFDPNIPLTETPAFGWFAGAGGGVRLPW